jgi:energy-coupling factor transporter ATP-binding protein EcfA2
MTMIVVTHEMGFAREVADRVVFMDRGASSRMKSVAQRKLLAGEDADEFGRRFILFPNNTDGHWMRAIFGESEPADTPAYRERMLQAALNQVP